MKVSVGEVALPGDHCEEITATGEKGRVLLGPGLRKEADGVFITKPGVLRKRLPHTFWVDSYQKRYVPAKGDNVIGTVTQKLGDIYRVDIGSSANASLSYLSFEGATKKNRPKVIIGDIVYAKLLVASKDMEPELVCVDSLGKKGRLGVLEDGFMFKCSINLVRKILNTQCHLIQALKKEWPFEIAAGMNGRIWVKANSSRETIAVGNAILASEYASNDEIKQTCKSVANILAAHVS